MQKHVELVLAITLCLLIAPSLISTNALNMEQRSQATAEDTVSMTTHTLAYSITTQIYFPKPTITESRGYHTVTIKDALQQGEPSMPVLPYTTLRLLLPQGREFESISLTPGNRRLLEGDFTLEYGRTPIQTSSKATTIDSPNPAVYGSSNPYPTTQVSQVSEQHLRGYRILLITLSPVEYIPKMGQLSYFETMTVQVSLRDSSTTAPLLRNLSKDKELVRSTVDNPEALSTYTTALTTLEQPTSIVDPADTYDYVIITNEALNASFQPLIDWKIGKGLNATTVLVESILADPDYFSNGLYGDGTGAANFNDTAARVRNFIKDAYTNWETEYILLGGDTTVVPRRGTYGFVATDPITVDTNIPCDMYFVALDGSWNNDNDTIFGEGVYPASSKSPQNGTAGDEADLYAELYIGRAPVTTTEQVNNFVNKIIWYENNTDDSYFKKAVMLGEKLDDTTEGANNKDIVSDRIPQYTTRRYYSRDGTYSRSNIINAINSGTHILNHDGHTNEETMMSLSRIDVDTVLSNTEYFLGYSVGCYAAAIDLDAVMEHFVFSPYGAFAFVGNTRYGWYMPGTTLGTGDLFDQKFFEILNNTENVLGKTLQASKEYFAGSISGDSTRWTYYQLLVLGDPETSIVTEIMAPTAQFKTDPAASRLSPPTFQGFLTVNGTARRGTAPGATFNNFKLEYGTGTNPSMWLTTGIELIDNGQNETTRGNLATWNITLFATGTYTLKLTSNDTNGVTGEDRWIVRIREFPAIRIAPQLVQTQEGLTFTVSARITKPVDLWALNFNMSWDTSMLEYVSHSVYIPADTYMWGVLYSPVTISKDIADPVAGTYWIAASSSGTAATFNKDGTVFNMTFRAIDTGTCYLTVPSSELKNKLGQQLTHTIWGGTVEINPGVHDMAVTAISPTGTLIGQGYNIKIKVTIANVGTFTEDSDFTVYANETVITTVTVSALAGLTEAEYIVTWNTAGWDYGDYAISVNVTAVTNETEIADNFMADGSIRVTLAGDADGDFDVDIFDIVKIAGSYGAKEGQPKYDANCDCDKDGDVDIFDVVIAASNYGKKLP